MNIHIKDVRDFLDSTRGRFFTVAFERRNDSKDGLHKAGDLRVMNCRTGVTYDLKGGPAAYDPKQHNLYWVYDMQVKKGTKRRSINLEALRWIKYGGKHYTVVS